MKCLQWFPGHMTAAMRMMEENLKAVDGVIIILDGRAPFASVNGKLDDLFKNKKVLYVLNKCDLIEKDDAVRAVKKFRGQGKTAIAVSAFDKRAADALYDAVSALLKEKTEKNERKGVLRPMRVMVAGIPNTGKSTVINALSGGKKTATGNKAGVTRGKQWVRLRDLELLDTPGTMPPAFSDQTLALHLAYLGCMNDANLDFGDLAFELLKELSQKYPQALAARYGIETGAEPLDMMNAICERRGFLLKGGEYDYDRCASAVIDDFRKGRMGKIFLDPLD
ncbi:MAG: ribosome biogenesis GTPase YlqF [Clostridia bacterium]|nr:ribosome biogenesis GTPase YlqF [Clostridia bacterium]